MCVRIEEVIGQRIRDRRIELGRSQESVAKAVGAQLGREWTRQAVSAAEKGKRSFTASELAAIAHVLVTNIPALFTPPAGEDRVELGDGAYMDRAWFQGTLLPAISTGVTRKELEAAAHELVQRAEVLRAAAIQIGETLDRVNEKSAALTSQALGVAR